MKLPPRGRRLTRGFFEAPPEECAVALLGCLLVWHDRAATIVETEAYSEAGDPACHTVRRPSARAFIESHPAGSAYVCFNYGMHWMLNVLTRGPVAGFVLFRALEPVAGIEAMQRARGTEVPTRLCSGPGRLARALGVTGADHGLDLCRARGVGIFKGKGVAGIVAGPRVGISSGRDLPWRFAVAENPHVSSPRPGCGQKEKAG